MPLADDFVSHYTLDSDYTDGVSSNNLTLMGSGGSLVSAKLGNGFDGGGAGYLRTAGFSGIDAATGFTVDFWFNMQTSTHLRFPFAWTGVSSTAASLRWNSVNQYFDYQLSGPSGTKHLYSPVFDPDPIDEWIHFLLWYDTQDQGWRINNTEYSQLFGSCTGSLPYFALLSDPGGTYPIDGIIDNVGVWDRKLTEAECDTRYNADAGLAYPFPTPIGSQLLIW